MKTRFLGFLAVAILAGPMSVHAASYFVRENTLGPALYVDGQTSISVSPFVDIRGNLRSVSANLADGTLRAYAEAPSGSVNVATSWIELGDTLSIVGLTAPTLVTVQIQITGTNSGSSLGAGGAIQVGRGLSCSDVFCGIIENLALTQFVGFNDPSVSEVVSAQVPVDPANPSFAFYVRLVAQTNPVGIADFSNTAQMSVILPEGLSFSSASGVFLTAVQPKAQLSLKQPVVAGCKSVVGTVTLPEAAPIGGTVVTLSDTLATAITPLSVKVAAGATSAKFTIKTLPTSLSEAGQVTATLNGSTVSQPLTVRPMGLLSVALSPTTTVGSQPVVGTAKLECKAGPGPITVDLVSNNSGVASAVASSIVVPQGLQTANFDVATSPVLAKTTASISGTANGIKKSKTLTVNVAAAVSPTSLKFGSVAVGATSATQTVTLSNKGVVPFSVSSIGLTGTNATWFVLQSNTCPANLPAGGSCTIGVQFKPISAASKAAKLSIATSAASTPLGVSLSGTGF